jgi:hypothetical protein
MMENHPLGSQIGGQWRQISSLTKPRDANPLHAKQNAIRELDAAVAAWPALALVGSYELLLTVIRSSQAALDGAAGSAGVPDRFRNRRSTYPPIIWQWIAFPQSVRSALSSTLASLGRSGCGTTSLQTRERLSPAA